MIRAALVCSCAVALCAPAAAARRPNSPDQTYGAYVLAHLAEACGFGARVVLCKGPVAFAQAVVIDDREVILYNSRSLGALESGTGTPWAAVSVIAHELGHHYYGHSHLGVTGVPAASILQCELDADYFSGYVLARVGASLADAQAAQRSLDSEETLLHPGSAARLVAIEAGWRDGRAGLPISTLPAERIECLMPDSAPAAPRAASVCKPLSPEAGRW